MIRTFIISLASSALISGGILLAPSAFADGILDHPLVNEVKHRLENQQDRITTGVQAGQLKQEQAQKDREADELIAGQLSQYETMHDGEITKDEQDYLNDGLNENSERINRQIKDKH